MKRIALAKAAVGEADREEPRDEAAHPRTPRAVRPRVDRLRPPRRGGAGGAAAIQKMEFPARASRIARSRLRADDSGNPTSAIRATNRRGAS